MPLAPHGEAVISLRSSISPLVELDVLLCTVPPVIALPRLDAGCVLIMGTPHLPFAATLVADSSAALGRAKFDLSASTRTIVSVASCNHSSPLIS